MKIVVSFCFVTFLSLFLFNCSQKESSLVAPEESSNLFKGKGGGQPISSYVITGDITGNGLRENITLTFGTKFEDICSYLGAGNTSKTGIAYNARSHNDPIFVFYFDYLEEVGGYQGKFRCEGNFGKKEPLVYDGEWIFVYFTAEGVADTLIGSAGTGEFKVVETITRGNANK